MDFTADGVAEEVTATAPKVRTFDLSSLSDAVCRREIAEHLRDHGYLAIKVLNPETEVVTTALSNWEDIFRKGFEQLASSRQEDPTGKPDPSPYRCEHGATLGIRRDETREFFETRRSFDGAVDPSVPGVIGYDECVLEMFDTLSHIGRRVVTCLTEYIHLDENYMTDLMDQSIISEEEHFSSSVLRICNYMPEAHCSLTNPDSPDIAFGSHTDTSFVTVAPVSSNNGLELMDLSDGSWHLAEEVLDKTSVVVFTGECLQMLTKSYYRACVHRVRVTGKNNRISCPLIMRGRKKALIRSIDEDRLIAIPEYQRSYIPDLSGTSMGLIHKMLDFKRLKCRKQNENSNEDWVLAAYPVHLGSILIEDAT